MSAENKTTDAEIIATARRLIERHGHDGFSMYDIATAVEPNPSPVGVSL